MKLRGKDEAVHVLFDIGLVGKAIDGVLQVIGGVVLAFASPDQVNRLARLLTRHELRLDPHDLVAGFLLRSAQELTAGSKTFAATFLLWHGAVKLVLVVGLVRRQRWAYPTAMIAFGAFLVYQLYRYSHTRSAWLLAISILDLFVIVLTWFEYQRLRRAHALRGPPLG